MIKHIGLAAALLTSVLATSANAAPAQVTKYQFRGLSGTANAYSYDTCTQSGVVVGANKETSRPDGSGPPVTEEFGYVYWFSYNWCEFTFTGGYADGALTVTGGQSTLRASGQLNGFNFNSEAVTVELDVTIDATGNYVSHGLSMYSNFTPYGSSRTRAVGTFAEATVSGSITVAGASVLGVISESYGTLLWANSGSVELWHP